MLESLSLLFACFGAGYAAYQKGRTDENRRIGDMLIYDENEPMTYVSEILKETSKRNVLLVACLVALQNETAPADQIIDCALRTDYELAKKLKVL